MAKAKLDPNCAIKIEGVGKTFLIPKHKIDSMRGLLFNLGRRGPYEKLEALQDVSFEIQQGEFFGIIGRNGSGKSTLLKLLARIYPPARGKIMVNGRISPFLELGVGFNPELTARENVYLNGVILGLTRKQIDQRFDKIIAFAELERFVDAKLKNFSSGMYVRLAFAVAIQVDADILLMDEVLAVGDVGFQAKCLEVFQNYRKQGKTVVLVTHDLATVQRNCSKALLLEKGRIAAMGDAEEVVNAYLLLNRNLDAEKQKVVSSKIPQKKELKPERSGSGEVAINKVSLLDQQGVELLETTLPNSPSAVQLRYLTKQAIDKPSFGIGIYKLSGEQVASYRINLFDNIQGAGMVEFRISPNLPKGQYLLSAACTSQDLSQIYEHQKYIHKFKIT